MADGGLLMCDTMRMYNEYLRGTAAKPNVEVPDMMPEYRKWENLKAGQPLRVYFMQDVYKASSGDLYNCNEILDIANGAWQLRSGEDCFIRDYRLDSDGEKIRVEFKDESAGSWSMLGSEAQFIEDNTKPTMVLCLKDMNNTEIKAMIVHQFGHALGLGHALMHPKEWCVLERFVNVDKMMRSYGLQIVIDFEAQWMGRECFANHEETSVMQYCTNISWLNEENHRIPSGIPHLQVNKEDKQVLKNFHQHVNLHGAKPSPEDIKYLQKAYLEQTSSNSSSKMYLGKEAPDFNDLAFLRNRDTRKTYSLTNNIAADWRTIANHLHINPNQIISIDRKYDDSEKIGQVFGIWCDNGNSLAETQGTDYKRTWDGLHQLLIDINEKVTGEFFDFLADL